MKRLYARFLLALALAASLAGAGFANAQDLPANSYQLRALVIKEARSNWGMDVNVALIAAQIHQESAWKVDAKSWVGATGLGQHMPATAADLNARYKSLASEPIYSPLWSIRATVIYDRDLWRAIKPIGAAASLTDCDRTAMMLSSYNGGLGWLNRDRRLTIAAGQDPNLWFGNVENHSRRAKWAIKENRDYPVRIIHRHLPRYLAAGWPGKPLCSLSSQP